MTWGEDWDVDLKKGWNIVYINYTETDLVEKEFIRTERPADVNLSWRFLGREECCCDSWDSWSSRSTNTRATENRRSVFRR